MGLGFGALGLGFGGSGLWSYKRDLYGHYYRVQSSGLRGLGVLGFRLSGLRGLRAQALGLWGV